jgi:hypothetical protein
LRILRNDLLTAARAVDTLRAGSLPNPNLNKRENRTMKKSDSFALIPGLLSDVFFPRIVVRRSNPFRRPRYSKNVIAQLRALPIVADAGWDGDAYVVTYVAGVASSRTADDWDRETTAREILRAVRETFADQ